MGILATIKNKTGNVITNHKTDICFGAGMLTLGFGIFALCKASTKLPEKTNNLETAINDIAAKAADNQITEEQAKKEIRDMKVQAGCEIGKDYIIGGACVIGGIAMVAKSYTDVKKDNVRLEQAAAAMAIAYGRLQNFTNDYRARVIAEEGADKDTHYAFGTTQVEVTNVVTDEEGNQTEQKTISHIMPDGDVEKDLGMICIYPGNPLWMNDPGMMLTRIKNRFKEADTMLINKEKISRNDVLDLFYVDKDYSVEGRPGYIFDPKRTGRQIDWVAHFVSRDKDARTKYIPQGANGLENYIIIELPNLNPDITVPRYRFQ